MPLWLSWRSPTQQGHPQGAPLLLASVLPSQLFFLTIIVANVALIQDLTGKKLFRRKASRQPTDVVATPAVEGR